MKKSILIGFIAFLVALESCQQEKDELVPDLPEITSSKLEFVAKLVNDTDGFRLTFEFSDGSFDFGLNPNEVDYPYHQLNFFLTQNNEETKITSTVEELSPQFSDTFYFIQPLTTHTGKLETFERAKARTNSTKFSCKGFTIASVGLKASDETFIHNTSRISETISNSDGEILIVKDSFRYETNRTHFNLLVDYLVEQPDGSFKTFEWATDFCQPGFNARVPVIGAQSGSSGPFEITVLSDKKARISYSMTSLGFRFLFGGKRVKTRLSIIDRSLNESNAVETQPVLVPN